MKPLYVKIFIFSVYLLLLILGLYHHEMWRDEYEEFLQARDAEGLFALGSTMSQGHAMLWQGCLWVITRFTHNPISMQIFHALIAACFALVLIFKSPFKVWQCALLLLGYFFLFEYAIISRCYAFGVLFIFLFTHQYSTHGKLTWAGAILILLFANTSLYALLLSMVLVVWIFYNEGLIFNINLKEKLFNIIPKLILSGLGILLAYIQIHPQPDNNFPINLVTLPFDQYRFDAAITQFFSAFVPICKYQYQHFWNTNFMMNEMGIVHWIWSLLLLIILSVPFIRQSKILILWLAGIFLILFFQYYTGFRYARYYGHLFVWWLACFWLLTCIFNGGKILGKINNSIFFLVIISQTIGGILIYKADWNQKFSKGAETANFLKKNGFAKSYMIGSFDFALSPIAAELNRKIYYMEHNKLCSFTKWDKARESIMDSLDLIKAMESAPKNEPFIFIATHPIPQFEYFKPDYEKKQIERKFRFENFNFDCLSYFKPGIEQYEGYWIFKAEKNKN